MKKFKKIFFSILTVMCMTGIFTGVFSKEAFAAVKANFSATIECGTAGYGVVEGIDNDKTFTLDDGSATINVDDLTSGGIYSIYLYKDGFFNTVKGKKESFSDTTSFTVSDLSSGTYYLKIAVNGASGSTYSISGTVEQ